MAKKGIRHFVTTVNGQVANSWKKKMLLLFSQCTAVQIITESTANLQLESPDMAAPSKKPSKVCELCQRRMTEHTSQEKKDCKTTLELLAKLQPYNPNQGELFSE
jgi:hypothetical protein